MSELYKLSDGWEWKKLRDICKFENGDRGKNYPSKSAFVNNGIPVISAKDLNGWSIDSIKLNYINEEHYNLISSGKIKKNDILFCLRGSLGKCAIVNNLNKGVIASSLVIVRTNRDLLTKLLLYYFNSKLVLDFINEYNNGAAQPNLSARSLSSFEFPLPPLSEQQRIVAKLDNLFEKIDKAITLHVKNMKEADAFMESVLNDVFGELEEKYEKYNLDMIADLIDGDRGKNYPKKDEFFENEYCLFLNAKNVTKNGFKFSLKQFITKEKDEILRKGKLEREDLIITTRGTIGNVSIYDNSIEYNNVRINSGMAIIRIKDINKLYNRFIYKYLFSPQFLNYLNEVQTGSAQPQITIKNLKESSFSIPPFPIQQKIVNYLDKISLHVNKVKQLQKEKMDNLKALKASILDKAFRGEL